MADPYNPYLMPQPAPDWRQVLSNALIGVGGGISNADASGRGWAAGIGPGLMYANQMTGQQNQNAWQRQMQGLQYQSLLDQRRAQEEMRREKLDMAKAAAAREAALGDSIGTLLGMNVQPNPVRMGPDFAAGDPASVIGGMESGGRYDAVGPAANSKGQRAYGKYQVMDFNVGPWTKEALGVEMTPQQFLASPQAQDAVFKTKFGQYRQQYGNDEAAARAWFAGPGGMNNPNAKDVLGTSVADYSRKFNAGRGGTMVAQGDAIAGQGDAPSQSAIASLPAEVRGAIGIVAQSDPKKAATMLVDAIQNQEKEGAWVPLDAKNKAMFPNLDQTKEYLRNRRTGEIKPIGSGSQVTVNTGTKAVNKFIEGRGQNFEEKVRPAAQAAATEIEQMYGIRQLLDAGAITGVGAEQRLWLAKLAETLGMPNEEAANTQALMSAAAERVLAVVKTLGANPSNADRQYLEKARAGSITFTDGGLRRILDIGERSARKTISRYHDEAGRLRKVEGLSDLPDEYWQIDTPPSSYDEWAKANPMAPPVASGVPPPTTPAPPDTAPPADAKPGAIDPSNIPSPKSKADYDNLPKGTTYLHPDGSYKVKK